MHALETDLYQLTMAAGYWNSGLTGRATFELFVRRLPQARSFLVAAGLDAALGWLEAFAFDDEDRQWLKAQIPFAHVPAAFFDEYLARLRFTGDVWAVAEGTPVFANEPILRVTAPLPEAQLVETGLLAIITFATSVATKAARVVEAAEGRSVIEFGARRAHGLGAALAASRAAYLGGCDGTSFVEAARRFGIPASGTMAHSWVQAFADEIEAFRAFSRVFPETAVYLLDTYDTVRAAERLAQSGLRPPSVRLDSGDLDTLSRDVRRVLDVAGLTDTRIFVTGDLDEYRISTLVRSGAPIDGFGVGTALTTVDDAPSLSGVYKLVEVDRHGTPVGVVKLSAGKGTWPGPKQVWRHAVEGVLESDRIAAADEPPPADAVPLLHPVMAGGRRMAPSESLGAIRLRCREACSTLPAGVRRLTGADVYPVAISDALEGRRVSLAR